MTRGTPLSIVTTSWDDGHPQDLRVAELLASNDMVGTFYVPVRNGSKSVIGGPDLRHLASLGMEVGAHTVTHRVLTNLSDREIASEVSDSKDLMEQELSQPVPAFCYPRGRHDARVVRFVRDAGYTVARTNVSLLTRDRFDPLRMPVSIQAFPHAAGIRLRHAVRYANARGLTSWLIRHRGVSDWAGLALSMFRSVVEHGGVFHLWGHGWELEERRLWDELEGLVREISRHPNVSYLTNTGTWFTLQQRHERVGH